MRFETTGTTASEDEHATFCATLSTPVGDLLLAADATAMKGVYFVGRAHVPPRSSGWMLQLRHPILREAQRQMEEYFAGHRTSFTLPLRPTGTTFQKDVWRQIALIPYGKTVTYTELAERVGSLPAVRAVGTATGRNPLSIIIPCHRVLGKDGSLCGFAGGLDRKRQLIQLEELRTAPRVTRRLSGTPFGERARR